MRSSLSRMTPKRETTPEEIEELRKLAWQRQGVIAIRIDDDRLPWVDREYLRTVAEKLYGKRTEGGR